MKKCIVFGLFLALAGCGGSTDTATKVAADVTKACGVVVSVKDIAAVIAAAVNPAAGVAVTGVNAIAAAVCNQWKASQSTSSLTSPECVATVNGICVHKGK